MKYTLVSLEIYPFVCLFVRDGISSDQNRLSSKDTCIFDQICKQKIIDILNNAKNILNMIVSISAKLIIND